MKNQCLLTSFKLLGNDFHVCWLESDFSFKARLFSQFYMPRMGRKKTFKIFVFAVVLLAGVCHIKANNSSVAINATLSTSSIHPVNATSVSASSSISKTVTPTPATVDSCSGKEFWSDDKVDISCDTLLCAKTIFPLLTKYITCNKATTSKDVLSIAAKVTEYAANVAVSVTNMLPSSVLGNGSMTFVTEKFVVEAGYMNKEKSDLREWTSVPNFAQGSFPSYAGQRDKFKISKLILGSGVSKYFTVFFKDILSTSDVFNFNEAKPNSVTQMENLGLYSYPSRTGTWVINSQIVHLGIDPFPSLTDFTEITFLHRELSRRINHVCVSFFGTYGNPSSSWSTAGCHTFYSDRFKTICRCNSIGGFAVVSQVEEKAPPAKGFTRGFFTQVALAITGFIMLGLICCMLNPLIAGCFHLERVRIAFFHDFAFFMVYACFLVGVIVSENTAHADTVAGSIHFFQTAVMSWFLVEGIHCYHSINAVYDPEVTSPIFFYSTIGWGIPAAFSGACAGYPYKLEVGEFSWMKVSGADTGYFLAGPLFSVVGTLLIYVLIIYELSSWIGSRQDSIYRRAIEYIKRSILMITLAVLTWYSGILAMNRTTSLGYHYFFLALYSTQGAAIIYIHLLKNTEISEYRAMKKHHADASASATTEEDLMSLQSSMQFSKFDIRRSTSRLQSVKEEDPHEAESDAERNEKERELEDHAKEDDAETGSSSSSSDAEGFREEDLEDDDFRGYGRQEYVSEENGDLGSDEGRADSRYSVEDVGRIGRKTEESGRISSNTGESGRISRFNEGAGRTSHISEEAGRASRRSEGAGRSSRHSEGAGRTSRYLEEAGRVSRHSEEAGRTSRYSEDAGRTSFHSEDAGRTSRHSEGAGRVTRYSEDAGRASRHSEDAGRISRSMEETDRNYYDMEAQSDNDYEMDKSGTNLGFEEIPKTDDNFEEGRPDTAT